jgi:CBS domain-containing protein
MTASPYPTFSCGAIFPKNIFSKAEAEEEIRAEAEAKARAEAEEKTKAEAGEKAKAEAEERAKTEAERKDEIEAETRAKVEAEFKTKAEAEEKAKAEAEEKAKTEAEQKTKAKVEDKAKAEAEEKAKAEAEEKAKAEAEEKAKAEAEEKAKAEAEEKTKAEVEEKAKAEAEEKAKAEAEQKAKAEAEEKTKAEAEEETTTTDEGKEQPVSETIQKMTQSPAVLPGEAGHISLDVSAKDIMEKDIVWGSPDNNVQQALTEMQQAKVGYMMIGTDGVPEGIVSKSDIAGAISPYLRPAFAKWRRPLDDASLNIRVKWIMNKPVHTVKPETSVTAIMENMCQSGERCLPVVDEQGKVQGLVTVFDIFKVLSSSLDVSGTDKSDQAPPSA